MHYRGAQDIKPQSSLGPRSYLRNSLAKEAMMQAYQREDDLNRTHADKFKRLKIVNPGDKVTHVASLIDQFSL